MKTFLKHSFLGTLLAFLSISSFQLKAQPPLIPFEVSKCQDFFGMVEKGDVNSVKSCIKRKPEILSMRNQKGETPLMVAVAVGEIEMVAFLLKSGAVIDIENTLGERAIHLAAKSGDLEIVKELINHGADFLCKTNQGKTPLQYAIASGNIELVSYFEKLEISFYF